ncbi:uncharacterized protein LOC116351482, partial [Contarinia nasturtii]|uniref:uncharacterized protein LOC116351482 n=1 Tax=Contarinia nasturtii TaxID=265458 RepID=UPI0012D47C15
MTGRAKRFAEITTTFSYDQFKKALLDEYKRAYTVQDVFRQLKARTLKPDETPREYIVEMQYIASRSNIPETDLIDLIISGLNDKSVHASILYSARTLAELKMLMERYEKLRRASVQPRSSAMPAATMKQKPYVPDASANTRAIASASGSAPKSVGEIDLSGIRCYNCFNYGHYQSKCTAPKRPPNSCFICHEVGHTRHECPKKKKPEASEPNAVATVGNPPPETNYQDNWDIAEDENEVRRLATQLSSMQMVSVAFMNKQNKCTELISKNALFDSGSPVSFVRRSMVPFAMNKLKCTPYRGMGNKKLNNEAVVPLLVGRDLLTKLEVYLCQMKSYKYTACELIKIR